MEGNAKKDAGSPQKRKKNPSKKKHTDNQTVYDTVKRENEHGDAQKSGKPWTDEDKRYLIAHAVDGYVFLAMAMGRTEGAIRSKADEMGVRMTMRPRLGGLCPNCGRHRLRETSTRAYNMGLCPTCYEIAKADAMAERVDFMKARRRYTAEKRECQREKERARKLNRKR